MDGNMKTERSLYTVIMDDVVAEISRQRAAANPELQRPVACQISNKPEYDLVIHAAIAGSLQKNDVFFFDMEKSLYMIKVNMQRYAERIVQNILSGEETKKKDKTGKKIVVDYSSPNVAKNFHVGHLRATIIGHFVSNIYKHYGYDVVGINYLGDWGSQFGLVGAIVEDRKIEIDFSQPKVIEEIQALYVEANKRAETDVAFKERSVRFFQKMEEGDEAACALWQKIREKSIEVYKTYYDKMGVVFDVYSGESMYRRKSNKNIERIQQTWKTGKDAKGNLYVELEGKENLLTILRHDGTTTYASRDIAAVFDRINTYAPETIVYVVSTEQKEYLAKMFKIARRMMADGEQTQLVHVELGKIQGMSTRLGTVVLINDMIEQLQEMIKEKLKITEEADYEQTTLRLALAALLVQDYKHSRHVAYKFQADQATNMIGDTGVYVMYTNCRLASIAKKLAAHGVAEDGLVDYSILADEKTERLLFSLALFSSVIDASFKHMDPQKTAIYLFKICRAVNYLLETMEKLIEAEKHVARTRLLFLLCAKKIIKTCLEILGIQPIEQM